MVIGRPIAYAKFNFDAREHLKCMSSGNTKNLLYFLLSIAYFLNLFWGYKRLHSPTTNFGGDRPLLSL